MINILNYIYLSFGFDSKEMNGYSLLPHAQDKRIKISDDCPFLQFFEIVWPHFMNQTTVIYGSPNTGKSTIIEAILYVLKDYVPNIIVISPTDGSARRYSRRVPAGQIHKKVTEKLLTGIIKRQEKAMEIYGKVNDVDNLRSLFEKIENKQRWASMYHYISNEVTKSMYRLNQCNYDHPTKIELAAKIKETTDDSWIKLFKMAIKAHNWKDVKLERKYKIIIYFLDFNPHMILIMDDVSSEVKNAKIKNVLLKSFTNIRHLGISLILALHNDTNIPPDVRQNAFTSIFTDEENASAFFERRGSAGMSKNKKKMGLDIAKELFKRKGSSPNYRKLVYTAESLHVGDNNYSNFHYAYVTTYADNDFKVGSDSLWKLSEESKKELDDDDIFSSMNF